MLRTAFWALLVATVCVAEPTKFDNFSVHRVQVNDAEQLRALHELEQSGRFDFWREPGSIGSSVDVLVAPEQQTAFAQLMDSMQAHSSLMVENVQKLIDDETPKTRSSQFGWSAYHNLETIYAWLDEQIAAHPTILSGEVVGQTYLNRTIRAVRLSHKAGNPTIFIEANIHAREWITSATATWLLNELLTSRNASVQDLAQNFDWVIVPVFNVDGFEYTWRVNRMWRKTRQPHGHICYGTDPNRNWDSEWMSIGSSQNVCSETYAGPRAWSEPETKALSNFIAAQSNVKMYLAFHSYGQYFMFPYGFTNDLSADYAAQMAVAEKYKEAVAVRSGTVYRIGPAGKTIYPTSGNSVDWAYVNQNITLAYTVEFRDLGAHGFLLPADQIVPNGLEFLDGLLAAVAEGRAQNLL